MKISRFTHSALLLSVCAVLMSCGDAALGPHSNNVARSSNGVALSMHQQEQYGGWGDHNPDLISCAPLSYASVTRTIGREGGVINVGPHTLTIPRNALREDVDITATVDPSGVNHLAFQPEGLQFNKSAWLTMSYANCDLGGSQAARQIAYTDGTLRTIHYRLQSSDNARAQTVTGQLDHFSDYAVAW